MTVGSEETGLLVLRGGQGLGAMDKLGIGCRTSLVGCGSLPQFKGHAAGGGIEALSRASSQAMKADMVFWIDSSAKSIWLLGAGGVCGRHWGVACGTQLALQLTAVDAQVQGGLFGVGSGRGGRLLWCAGGWCGLLASWCGGR